MDRHAQLLHESQVVAVVPDLCHLAVFEAKDVDGGERRRLPVGSRPPQRPRCVPDAVQRPDDKIALSEDQVDRELEIRERGPEVVRDLLLSCGPGSASVERRSWRT